MWADTCIVILVVAVVDWEGCFASEVNEGGGKTAPCAERENGGAPSDEESCRGAAEVIFSESFVDVTINCKRRKKTCVL